MLIIITIIIILFNYNYISCKSRVRYKHSNLFWNELTILWWGICVQEKLFVS